MEPRQAAPAHHRQHRSGTGVFVGRGRVHIDHEQRRGRSAGRHAGRHAGRVRCGVNERLQPRRLAIGRR
ncbi:MAG: hypothetical protein DI618_07375, partial [Dermacoccus nishinomiyaensis]